jgi:hypothetical protein
MASQQPARHTCPTSSRNRGQQDGSAASGAAEAHAQLLAGIGGQYGYSASCFPTYPPTTTTTTAAQGAYNNGGAYHPPFPSYASPSSMANFTADADGAAAAAASADAAAAAAHASAAHNVVHPGQAYATSQHVQAHQVAASEVSWRQMMRGNDFRSECPHVISVIAYSLLDVVGVPFVQARVGACPMSVRGAVSFVGPRACLCHGLVLRAGHLSVQTEPCYG